MTPSAQSVKTTASSASAPWPPTVFDATIESLISDAQAIIDHIKDVQDSIVAKVSVEAANFANAISPLIEAENDKLWSSQLIEFYAEVSPSEELRIASREATRLLNEADGESSRREDLYSVVAAVRDKHEDLDTEDRRYLEKQLLSFERNGLALCAKDRLRLKGINKELTDIRSKFMWNFTSADHALWYTRGELEGLPDHFLDNLEKGSGSNEGQLRLTLEGLQSYTVFGAAKRRETRRRLYHDEANLHKPNVLLMHRGAALRAEKARLLGYEDFAGFRMADNMEKSPRKIMAFLEDLLHRIGPKRDEMVARWRQNKSDDLRQRGEPDDGKFYPWDQRYYSKGTASTQGAMEDISAYFPLAQTVKGMLRIFEQLFGLSFVELSSEDREKLSQGHGGAMLTWHEDVRLFAVRDDRDDHDVPRSFLGNLYMDLYHRPGKRPGFADLPVRPAYILPDGTRRPTSTALITSFDPPNPSKPTFLRHNEITVLFHELGHGIHDLVAHTRHARFHGASTASDFNEAPSQMLEQWCWIPEVLLEFSCHYAILSETYLATWRGELKDGSREGKMPELLSGEAVRRLSEGKKEADVNRALALLGRSLFDMRVHMARSREEAEDMDLTALWHDTMREVWRFDEPDERVAAQAVYTDMFTVDGMYIYLTSQVYMLDMFKSTFEQHPMSREVGLRYRDTVIGNGSSMDEMELLRNFLGREPSSEAFYKELGLA